MVSFAFHTVPTLVCQLDCALDTAAHCQRLGMKHVVVVTDKGVTGLQLHEAIVYNLQTAGLRVTVYDQIIADPPEAIVIAAAEHARRAGVDGVIGLGGGSSMDVAKLIALLAHPEQQQPLATMYGVEQVTGKRLPLIQIPTTAGTGSEVTPVAIVTTGETTKMGIVSRQLLADVALLDANLTLGLPPAITAATGIDAMVHAIEAYTSIRLKNPYADLLACEALKMLDKHLQTAIHDGHNPTARQHMLLGAMLAGQAFANAPVAAVHALAYPLGGHFHLSHGHSNALVLVEVLKFNLPKAAHWYAELYSVLDPHCRGNDTEKAEKLINRLEQHLVDSLIPLRLRELAVPESSLSLLARDAMLQTRLLQNNPRPLTQQDALGIYQSIY